MLVLSRCRFNESRKSGLVAVVDVVDVDVVD